MKITIIGVGYVGLVAGTCFSSLGNDVICVDIDEKKIDNLNRGILPIYEPGLKELVEQGIQSNRLQFTIDIPKGIKESDIIFIAVGTPQDSDGKADLKYVFSAAKSIGENAENYKVIVDKSTVPVGTAEKVTEIIKQNQKRPFDFDVVSNPEFLREGAAVKDFLNPDRVVIGTNSERAAQIMVNLYKPLERSGKPIITTDPKSAEMIKYAANAMLATRISFINEIARLCEKVGADVKVVAKGIGLDDRIGPRFLQAGVGYGGSCFPKDVRALIQTAKENGVDLRIVKAVDDVNEEQKKWIIPKIKSVLGDLHEKKIAVWGLAFKPKTDDMREAPSILIIQELQRLGAKIIAFDPVAEGEAKHILRDVEYGTNPYDVLKDVEALVLVTEWDEFRELDKNKMKSLMRQAIIFDGRNVYDPKEMARLEFKYFSIGR